MRLIEKYHEDGKPVYKTITWDEHRSQCGKCAGVKLAETATYGNTCAQGGKLLMEESIKRQAPVEKKKKEKVLEWAKATGVFKV